MRQTDAQERKNTPIYSGVLAYFPDAIAAVARVSKVGNDQHNPGAPLHWDRSKSTDEYDACTRHLVDRCAGDEYDDDGQRHMAKVAWRALAALQKEIENSNSQKSAETEAAPLNWGNDVTATQYQRAKFTDAEIRLAKSRCVGDSLRELDAQLCEILVQRERQL